MKRGTILYSHGTRDHGIRVALVGYLVKSGDKGAKMTLVGHSLTGLAIGMFAVRSSWPLFVKILVVFHFGWLAYIPDFPFPGWGHNNYLISHSIFVNLAIVGVVAAVLAVWRRVREVIGYQRIVLCGTGAWLSHLLLDSFYNHGIGIRIYWPFSDARFALPIPWLGAIRPPPQLFTLHNLYIFFVEFVTFFPLFALSILAIQRLGLWHEK